MPRPTAVAETLAEKNHNAKREKEVTNEKAPKEVPPGKKKRGRPPKNSTAPKENKSVSRLGGIPDAGERDRLTQDAERVATAEFCVTLIEQSGVALAGNDAKMHELERQAHVGVWDKYLLKAGIKDIPPGVALVLVTGQYYARVFSTEQARPKALRVKTWFATKFMRLKNARSNRRNDSQRKNQSGKNDDSGIQKEGDKDSGT